MCIGRILACENRAQCAGNSNLMGETPVFSVWGKRYCPIIICTTTYYEQTVVQRSFTPEEAYQTAIERARRILQQTMPQDSVFIRESSGMHRSTQDGVIQAEVVWIVDEPLGQIAQVSLP